MIFPEYLLPDIQGLAKRGLRLGIFLLVAIAFT